MKYFAYGSNMSIARLRERISSAVSFGCHALKKHDLRFHKSSKDGSGKCDAFFTDNEEDTIFGVLFEINSSEKSALDRAEGLGFGYDEKEVTVIANDDSLIQAITYIATNIDESLMPYSWYVNHVLVGANETSFPEDYVQRKIIDVQSIVDDDKTRDAKERAIHV